MMDKKLVFFEAQSAKAAITGTAVDFGQEKPTTGLNDRPLYVVVQASADLAGTGSLTVTVEDSADGNTFATALQAAVIIDALKGGKSVALPMPLTHRRYVRVTAKPSTTGSGDSAASTITAGTATSYLSDAINVPMNTPLQGIEYITTAS